MKHYFKRIETLEELRRQYKELLRKHHPDNGGEVSVMQDINAEYEKLFQLLKDKHEKKEEERKREQERGKKNGTEEEAQDRNREWYDWESDRALREVLQKIIGFSEVLIDIVGYFIWLYGDTYSYKKELKELGFRWSRQRKKWYWHNGKYKNHGSRKLSYEEIQGLYGSTEVRTEERKRIG